MRTLHKRRRKPVDRLTLGSFLLTAISTFAAVWSATHPSVVIVQPSPPAGNGTKGAGSGFTVLPPAILLVVILWVFTLLAWAGVMKRRRRAKVDWPREGAPPPETQGGP
ncbi:MAG: hypothetical protein KGJ23_08435 [Euryarchaeota archaeon]|nr:hypothetical protein [Euryarchaeota archaeon]MDE1836629.1 hypothetical protein [Euryarchaeota archaeon]MDE1879176.1 hypothetical protein [Euryarchaeota archaeon]MDE2044599.1 hypothetical protein [Thermoplasmata archaeon]